MGGDMGKKEGGQECDGGGACKVGRIGGGRGLSGRDKGVQRSPAKNIPKNPNYIKIYIN